MPFELIDEQAAEPFRRRGETGLCSIGEAVAEVLAQYGFADLERPSEMDFDVAFAEDGPHSRSLQVVTA